MSCPQIKEQQAGCEPDKVFLDISIFLSWSNTSFHLSIWWEICINAMLWVYCTL